MTLHPAHTMPFDALLAGLKAALAERLVYERPGPDGLALYVYTERCVYEAAWDVFTISARGLILDIAARRIVATPFPKFFNAGERDGAVPDLPFETTEKLDGSLIIIFHHSGKWRAATKGAFASTQALWAQARLDARDLSALVPGVTYLAEATYPENKIIVFYPEASLRMLAAYGADGVELEAQALAATGFPPVKRLAFDSVAEMLAKAKGLPRSEEGYVVRFADGLRLKIKGDEYRRIHALISGLTPLNIWRLMSAGDDLEKVRRDLPEEFWADFDALTSILRGEVAKVIATVASAAQEHAGLSDKELGLKLSTLDEVPRQFIFSFRKSGGDLLQGRTREQVFRAIRPDGNVLAGYKASSAMNRIVEEDG